jgi:hypothetical protein
MKARTILSAAFLLAGLAGAVFSFGLQEESKAIFNPKGRLLSEGRIFSFACHDFDRDGHLDIVVSDYLYPARILYGDADLAFKRTVGLTATAETATTGHGVALRDFDGDGRLDLFLVFNEFVSRIFLGNGRGGFADSGRAIGPAGFNGTSVRAADFDGDGDTDALVTYYRNGARLYLNDGAGVLTESDTAFAEGLETGDLDGDGDLDALSLEENGTVSFWSNDKGRFIRRENILAVGEGIIYIRLVDYDGDGDQDLVALRRDPPSSLWENDGRGGYRKLPQELSSGTRLAAGDIDRDGRMDLVVGSGVWLNKGGGKFQNVQTVDLGMAASLDLVDVDGDGDLDLLMAGLDRATNRADLKLFLNTRSKR